MSSIPTKSSHQKRLHQSIRALIATSVTVSLLATPALAQEKKSLEEVLVTARRQAENLQNVPVAVAAFNQEMLTQNSVTSAFDVSKIVPGLTITADSGNPSLPSFAIRGRGQSYGAAAGSVETYFADVPLSSPFQMPAMPPQFFDVASFQVLKGPQGTLFGRSTTGGAVLIVPETPKMNEISGYARVQGGDYGNQQFEGALNLPILDDTLALRLAVFHWKRDGYMKTSAFYPGTTTPIVDSRNGGLLGRQEFSNQNTDEVRATLLWRPSDAFENSTIVTWHRDDTKSSSGGGLMLDGSGNTVHEPGYNTRTAYIDTNLDKPANTAVAFINTTTIELAEQLSLKNIFGYIHAEGYTNDAADADGTAATIINIYEPLHERENKQYTDEVQLNGRLFADRLNFTLGALVDRTREPGGLFSMNAASTNPVIGAPTIDPAHPGAVQMQTRFQQNSIDSEAAFISLTYAITDQLNATAGYRHSWDDVRADQASAVQASIYQPYILSSVTFDSYKVKSEGDVFNAGVDYHLTSDVMVYGGWRRGYKHGGFNSSQTSAALASFGPEKVDSFNLGMKSSFNAGDMLGRFNIEGFYDKYKGMQFSYLSLAGANLTTITTNVPKTTFRGFDMDFVLEPTEWMSLNGSYTYIDAFHTEWPDTTVPGSTLDLTENIVPFVSRNKYNLALTLHTELPNDIGELLWRTSYTYQDRFITTPFNKLSPAAQAGIFGQFNHVQRGAALVDDYSTVDTRLEWNHLLGSRFDTALTVTNLTDEKYFVGNSGTLNFGVQGNAYAPPRMYTVEVSTKF
jgi:iron complex outermembrane receptor protein